jgi:hypothetical protein
MTTISFFLYANWSYAGTGRFKHHIIAEGADRTLCGLCLADLRGQWEYDDFRPADIGCLKCKKFYQSKPLTKAYAGK